MKFQYFFELLVFLLFSVRAKPERTSKIFSPTILSIGFCMAFASQFEYIIEAQREVAERIKVHVIFVFDFLMNLKNLTL